MRNLFFLGLAALILFSVVGCGGRHTRESFLRENVDLAFVQKIAVLPFENHTGDQFVAKRARDIVITRILAQELFDVADKGLVDSRLVEEAVNPSEPIDPITLKRLGQGLGVQAFLLGSVGLADGKSGARKGVIELSMTLRLVDASTGMVLWQASGYRNSESLVGRLFGFEGDDAFRVALKLARNLLSTIPAGSR